jgi:hypothetical protein
VFTVTAPIGLAAVLRCGYAVAFAIVLVMEIIFMSYLKQMLHSSAQWEQLCCMTVPVPTIIITAFANHALGLVI